MVELRRFFFLPVLFAHSSISLMLSVRSLTSFATHSPLPIIKVSLPCLLDRTVASPRSRFAGIFEFSLMKASDYNT